MFIPKSKYCIWEIQYVQLVFWHTQTVQFSEQRILLFGIEIQLQHEASDFIIISPDRLFQ